MVGGEIQFPEPIIQYLQFFLTGKEAARTTIVSKSWHSAWLTRPNLDFDDTHFRRRHFSRLQHGVDEFSKYANKTIKRYEKSNLKIESFKLRMEVHWHGRADLANKLILKALAIGATRLCFRLDKFFVLPHEVFRADNLVELSVSRCRIILDDGVVIKSRRLESLILDDDVDITAIALSNIISGCTSIEKLSLLSNVYFHYHNREAAATAIAVGMVDNLLHRLRCLSLSYVSFKTLCLGDLLSRFPLLKDFTLYLKCDSISIFDEEIQISNCSLERVKLVLEGDGCYYGEEERRWWPKIKFDVPSVRKFTYEGDTIPCLSFMSTPSSEWESHVSINCRHHDLTTFLFDELSEFLTELIQSKTHLSLRFDGRGFDYKLGDNIFQLELENLMIDTTHLSYLSCYALFDGLFRLCRPKLITQYVHPYNHIYEGKTNINFLCQTLEQGIKVKVSSPTQFMYGLNDLEEVKAQAFDVPDEWRPIPLKSLLDSDAPNEQQKVRLLLKWKPN